MNGAPQSMPLDQICKYLQFSDKTLDRFLAVDIGYDEWFDKMSQKQMTGKYQAFKTDLETQLGRSDLPDLVQVGENKVPTMFVVMVKICKKKFGGRARTISDKQEQKPTFKKLYDEYKKQFRHESSFQIQDQPRKRASFKTPLDPNKAALKNVIMTLTGVEI